MAEGGNDRGLLVELEASGEGRYQVSFDETKRSGPGVHGGVVVGALLRAAVLATGAWPATVSAHFHAPVMLGNAEIEVTAHREGRTVTSVKAVLRQGDRRATAQITLTTPEFANAKTTWPMEFASSVADLAAPEDVEPIDLPAEWVPFTQYLELRPLGDALPLMSGSVPALAGWIRERSSPAYEPALAAVLLDALAPSLYAVLAAPVPMPTIEFTAHFAPIADVSDWLLIRQTVVWATDDLCVDDAELRTVDGRLVAQSRQVRRILG